MLASVLLVGACGDAPPPASRGLILFVPASLLPVSSDLTAAYLHRDTTLGLMVNIAGAPQLVTMLERGARGDVLFTDDRRWMDYAVEKGIAGAPVSVATGSIVLAVSTRPEVGSYLQSPLNLASPGSKVVLAGPDVPLGRYSRALLADLNLVRGYGPDFADRVELNAISQEQNESAIVRALQDGSADAAFLYATTVRNDTSGTMRVMALPVSSPTATWWAAPVMNGDTAGARAFIEWMTGGQAAPLLVGKGFALPAETSE